MQHHQLTFRQLCPEGWALSAAIGIWCMQASGQRREEGAVERHVSTLEWWHADSGFCFWLIIKGALQSAHALLSADNASQNIGKASMHFLLDLVAVLGCCFMCEKFFEKPTCLNLRFGSDEQILACQQGRTCCRWA